MEDNNKTTPFHEEDLRRLRKDTIKRDLHELNKDPLGLTNNPLESPIFKYVLIFKSLNNLSLEMTGELKSSEEKVLDKYRNILENYLINKPIHYKMQKQDTYRTLKIKRSFSPHNWLVFSKILFKYQRYILKLDNKYFAKTKSEHIQKEY